MISEATRRDIFDFFMIEQISWSGRLDEPDFLARLYDLQQIPSSDGRFSNAHGDIYQHRVNNPYDWDDDWVFHDKRFELLNCDDEIFLKFFCEAVHPAVRPSSEECSRIVKALNDALADDGYKIVANKQISNRNYYSANKILDSTFIPKFAKVIPVDMNSNYIMNQIERMENSVDIDPESAIGVSKEFIERRIQVVSATPPVLDKKARCGNTLALYPPQMRELCTTRTLPRKNAITFSVV